MPEAKIMGRRLHYHVSDGCVILRPEEACDERTTQALATLVNSSIMTSKSLIIDLSHTDYVETPGFRWIIRQFRLMESMGTSLVLAGLPPSVERAFMLLKLDTIVPVAATVQDAFEKLGFPRPAMAIVA